MGFFDPISPAYRRQQYVGENADQCRPAASNRLSGVFGSVIGRATPAYKTANGQAAEALRRRGCSRSSRLSSPSYKTATQAVNEQPAGERLRGWR